MLGSAAQNVIALSDAVLLYHRGEVEFAAIGFVGVFYITIAAIGYSLSRGGADFDSQADGGAAT